MGDISIDHIPTGDVTVRMVPNIEYLGRCYDVLKTDPLSLGETSLPNIFDFSGPTYRTSLNFDVPQVYRPRFVRHRIGSYAASAMDES